MAKGDLNKKMDDLQQKMVEWGRGRNGVDELSSSCTNVAVLLVIIDLFAHTSWLSIVALVLLGYSWFRISSKSIPSRRKENASYVKTAGPVVPWLVNPISAARENKDYKHLSCPSCGQRVRIPRGKGKVRITCPKCHERFEGKA